MGELISKGEIQASLLSARQVGRSSPSRPAPKCEAVVGTGEEAQESKRAPGSISCPHLH